MTPSPFWVFAALAREALADALRRRLVLAVAVASLLSLQGVESCTSCGSATFMRNGEVVELPDEINYTAGFSVAVTPRLTLNFDVLGRSLRDQERFTNRDKTFPYRRAGSNGAGDPPNAQPPLTTSRRVFDLTSERGNVNLLLAVGGFKLNIAKTLLLTGNVLVPINDSGLRAKVAPVIGIDYAF